MAIFSRRILQRLIDENASFLTAKQVKKHVVELNNPENECYLAFEWEVVLLNALSKIGKSELAHEKSFEGGTRFADIYFESCNDRTHNFIADITTVSDKGIDKQNPFDALFEGIMYRVAEKGLRKNCFGLEVEAGHQETSGNSKKIKLKIPGTARFPKIIFNDDFNAFLTDITHKPDLACKYEVKREDVQLTVTYNPSQTYACGHHTAYTEVCSLTENLVYSALHSKALQLKSTSFAGPCGIFLCDGDCDFFRSISLRSPGAFSIDHVIQHFLKENPSIVFVITFSATSNDIGMMANVGKVGYQVAVRIYPGNSFDKLSKDIVMALEQLVSMLPKPQLDAQNALRFIKRTCLKEGRSYCGGMSVKQTTFTTEIKISARALLKLLAGVAEQQKFFEAHRFTKIDVATNSNPNPFCKSLLKGQLIDEIKIEKSITDDDDWLVFRLKGPNPAISPFRKPES
jgi:hypothetical protein